MSRGQLALVVIVPLLLVLLLTAANRFWAWPTEDLRVPVGIAVPGLLVVLFSKKNAGN